MLDNQETLETHRQIDSLPLAELDTEIAGVVERCLCKMNQEICGLVFKSSKKKIDKNWIFLLKFNMADSF